MAAAGRSRREKQLLADAELRPIAAPAVATDDDLLATLDAVSLASWRERRQALPAKAAAARAAAAKRLEPKSVAVKPPSATLKTADDVDAYLAQLREILHAATSTPARPSSSVVAVRVRLELRKELEDACVRGRRAVGGGVARGARRAGRS